MIWLVIIGLTIMPLSALVFGALFFRLKLKDFNTLIFLVLGSLAFVFDLVVFYRLYAVSITQNQWEAASQVLGLFSFVSTLNVLALGFLGNALYFQFINKNRQFKYHYAVAFICILTMGYVGYYHQKNQHQVLKLQIAQGPLDDVVVQNIKQQYEKDQDLAIIKTMLMNPTLSLSTMQEYSQSSVVEFKTALLTNINLPSQIVNEFAQSNSDVLKYYAAKHPNISNDMLQVLAKDPSKEVRKQAQTGLKLRQSQQN